MEALFERPLALAALFALAAFALWLATQPAAAARWTGAVALWRPSSTEAAAADRKGRRWSAIALFGLAACGLAVVSIAGPRSVARRTAPGAVVLVLDRSPSMFLPALDGEGSRIAAVVELAQAWCDARGIDGRARTWRALVDDRLQSASGARPPEAWLERGRAGGEPPWTSFDDANSLWLSDGGPHFVPLHAGVVLSGARVEPGAVARAAESDRPGDRWWWSGQDGDPLERRAGPVAVVAVDANLPLDLRELVDVWAAARGWRVEPLDALGTSEPELTFLAQPPSASGERESGFADAGAGPAPAEFGGAAGPFPEGVPRVAATFRPSDPRSGRAIPGALWWGPGRLWTPLVALDLRRGDSTAQALAWMAWLDRAAAASGGADGAGIVALTERAQRAEARSTAPAAFDGGSTERDHVSWAWVASLAAAALAAFAAGTGSRFSPVGVRFRRPSGLR